MTEAQERLIYEWLYPELKGQGWKIDGYGCDSCSAVYQLAYWPMTGTSGPNDTLSLPDLDYNTFMEEAVPKLDSEGITVSFVYHGGIGTWVLTRGVHDKDIWRGIDLWPQVAKYLEAK